MRTSHVVSAAKRLYRVFKPILERAEFIADRGEVVFEFSHRVWTKGPDYDCDSCPMRRELMLQADSSEEWCVILL